MSDQNLYAMIMGLGAFVIILVLAVVVLEIVAMWKIFTKAGEPGWKSIIPVYNGYVLYKICWQPMFFWVQFVLTILANIMASTTSGFVAFLYWVVSLALLVITVMQMNKLSKSFGKSTAFTVGLVLLNPIFMMMLGFGSAQYQGVDL